MKIPLPRLLLVATAAFVFETSASSFDVTTIANVVYIDEWDVAFTRVQIDQPTSCGSSLFWVDRSIQGYDLYMARVLAALMANRQIRITERAPAFCQGGHLYNPRVGNM